MKYTKTFESFINESHFKVGDKVTCIKSGMTGTVIGLDKPHGDEDEEYYEVEREDGEVMKYSPNELKLHEAEVNEASLELKKLEDAIKMFQDKIKKQGMVTNARDEEHLENLIRVYKEMGGKNIKESVVNEEYIELPSFMESADDMVDAFKQWYKDTASNWEDFKEDMTEDSVDEAAKNAQMEILSYLSNKMNDVIKDRKFKVNADFK